MNYIDDYTWSFYINLDQILTTRERIEKEDPWAHNIQYIRYLFAEKGTFVPSCYKLIQTEKDVQDIMSMNHNHRWEKFSASYKLDPADKKFRRLINNRKDSLVDNVRFIRNLFSQF